MPFSAGQTYLFPLDEPESCAHLWVIATDPDETGTFAVASFTSLRGAKDQTVVARKGEHPFLKWDSCIHYGLDELVSEDRLQTYLNSGRARMHQPVSRPLLALIVDGFSASDFTKNRVRNYVKARNP